MKAWVDVDVEILLDDAYVDADVEALHDEAWVEELCLRRPGLTRL